jgi:protein SCO1/2
MCGLSFFEGVSHDTNAAPVEVFSLGSRIPHCWDNRSMGTSRCRRFAVVLALGAACGRSGERRYPLMGVVQELQPETGKVVVSHGDIPGFMPAMIMPFAVAGGGGGLQPGDLIEADLVVSDTDSRLERVVVKQHGLAVAAPQHAGPPVRIGAPLPDFVLTNQDGNRISMQQYHGRALVVTFIYTRCPIPEFCPHLMRAFSQLEAAIAKDALLLKNTHLLTVSFDPEHDTPEVLRRYAEPFVRAPGANRFAHWELATGTKQQVKEVAEFFGLSYWGEGKDVAHSLRTGIVGPDGTLRKVYEDNDWTTDDALAALRAALEERK